MADRPALLAGVRVLESSLLGPGELGGFLADLGADVIKVEPPQGDYVRQMTWPIVEGESLLHLHIHRNKRSITLDLRQPEAIEVYLELAPRRGRGDRGDAAGRAGQARPRLREAEGDQPEDRVLLHLRLRRDRSLP